jgi:hypothetical protein
MCGRVRLSSDVSEIKLVFSIPPYRPTPNFPPSWNAAPTDLLPMVRYDRKVGERSLDSALGSDPALGQGHQCRLREYQRQGRSYREQARLPRGVPAAAPSAFDQRAQWRRAAFPSGFSSIRKSYRRVRDSDGSSNEPSLGSIETAGWQRISRRRSRAPKRGSTLPRCSCSPGD